MHVQSTHITLSAIHVFSAVGKDFETRLNESSWTVHVYGRVIYRQRESESGLHVLIMIYLHTRDHAVPSRGVLEAPSELLSRQEKIGFFL